MPIPVTTMPRFKCQFCLSHRGTMKSVTRHEGFCWQNPDRYCKECENTGEVDKYVTYESTEQGQVVYIRRPIDTEPCPYCSKEDKAVTAGLIDAKSPH